MADPLPFTAEMAETVREMRLSGASWDAVAARIGMSRRWCIERARLAVRMASISACAEASWSSSMRLRPVATTSPPWTITPFFA